MKQRNCVNIYLLLLITGFFYSNSTFTQSITLNRVEPPSWWIGFKNQSLQLMVYGQNISLTNPSINYPGLIVEKVHKVSNPNYLFIDLRLSGKILPGTCNIIFKSADKIVASYDYTFNAREKGSAERVGFNSSDVIYLMMPDRFANGDTSNDNITGMLEIADRTNPDKRHGGDIKGITAHTNYLKDMGFTAVWCTPLLENNMEKYSYHGYSITNYYQTDPRLGTNEDYKLLAKDLHNKGLKLVMDMVFNHCGSNHWWMKDLPTDDWIHKFPEFTRTSYRVGTVSDPYISKADRDQYQNGWFDITMPDLNQNNLFLARYLIQNTIWWIEYSGIDGIRVDTYPYCDKNFMSEWDEAIITEYPAFNIVGECWAITPETIAYWQKDSPNADGYNSHLPAVMDFPMYDALRLGFNEKPGWSNGIQRLYEIHSRDFVYPDPSYILTFADNHDVDRYLSSQNQDVRNLKMAIILLLTTRGIPQIFYGTEALLTTTGESSHGKLRMDFPGGWENDSTNIFSGINVTPAQKEMMDMTGKILNWRKNKKVIHSGKLTHFLPQDNTYAYFRHNDEETLMVYFNNNESEKKVDIKRFKEFTSGFNMVTDVVTGKTISISEIVVSPKTAMILELKK